MYYSTYLAAVVLFVPSMLFAQNPSMEMGKDSSSNSVPIAAGMTVTIDPAKQAAGDENIFVDPSELPASANAQEQSSGPDIQSALSAMVSTSSEGLQEQHLDNGAVLVDLQGRFQSAMVMTIDAQGQRATKCYSKEPHEHAEGEAFIHPPLSE